MKVAYHKTLKVLITRKKMSLCWWWIWNKFIVIILQYIHISNQYTIHLKLRCKLDLNKNNFIDIGEKNVAFVCIVWKWIQHYLYELKLWVLEIVFECIKQKFSNIADLEWKFLVTLKKKIEDMQSSPKWQFIAISNPTFFFFCYSSTWLSQDLSLI